jgi:alpha-ketoglutarate-dependent taurine dioxygenase
MEYILNINKLFDHGWVEVDGIRSTEALLALAESIGKIIPHPDGNSLNLVKPKSYEKAIKGSFSNRYGYGDFPLHTDTAFWLQPARYIIMASLFESNVDTVVISLFQLLNMLSKNIKSLAKSAIFIVKTTETSYYTHINLGDELSDGIRFDPCCMFPANENARLLKEKIIEVSKNIETVKIRWSGNNAVIIDNWKALHGREAILKGFESRTLARIYVG